METATAKSHTYHQFWTKQKACRKCNLHYCNWCNTFFLLNIDIYTNTYSLCAIMHACRIIFDVSSHLVALCFPHSSAPADWDSNVSVCLCCCCFFGAHNYFCFDRRWSCLFNTIFFTSFFLFLSCRFTLQQVRKTLLSIKCVFPKENRLHMITCVYVLCWCLCMLPWKQRKSNIIKLSKILP